MNRDLSISFVISVTLHLLALLALSLWTTTEISRDVSGDSPIVSVTVQPSPQPGASAPEPSTQNASAPAPPAPAVAPEQPPPERLAAAPAPSPPEPSVAEAPAPEATGAEPPADTPTPATAQSVEAPPADLSVAAAQAEALPVAAPDIVTAAPLEDPPLMAVAPRRAPPAAAVPMSAKQEKMLAKKLKKWSNALYEMDLRDATATWEYKDQAYKAEFVRHTADDTGMDEVVIEISTEEGGRTLSTEVRLRRLAFSNFAQFVNRWDPSVQIHDDELTGRFHSNTEITLGYSRAVTPVFHGKVTTASRAVNIARTSGFKGRDELFRGGLETGVRRIQLPKRFQPATALPAARVTQHFEGDTRLVFEADGTYTYAPADGSAPAVRRSLEDGKGFLTAANKSKLFVRGTLRGSVLVYSPADIVIEDDLIYAHDPLEQPDGDDYLGLVSDKSVVIAPPDVTGPGDLHVHGSIYAKRRFAVARYRARENATLHVYGSVSAGSVTATEPRYATKIEFDRRLETRRAPGFPMTNRYEAAAWDRSWRTQ